MTLDWPIVLVSQLAVTGCLTGLIWFVQIVHYPLFVRIGPGFAEYHRWHVRRTTWVVGVLMPMEAVGAAALLILARDQTERGVAIAGLGLLVLIWLSTGLLQVPDHNRLAQRYEPQVARRLVWTNWLRVLAWTARLFLLAWLAHRMMTAATPS
ncbi:MAG: hypothetical protein JJU36_04650 [Phycisphaeraceae bacterium]|nr:hypothetical protein [Phycisphaeraceae bacterium]